VPTIRRAEPDSSRLARRPETPSRADTAPRARTAEPPARTAIPRRTAGDDIRTQQARPSREQVQTRRVDPRRDAVQRTTRADGRERIIERGRVLDTRNREVTRQRETTRTVETRSGGIRDRSTLSGHTSTSLRAGSTSPHASLPRATTRTTVRSSTYRNYHGGFYRHPTYRPYHHGYYSPWYASGVSVSFGIGFGYWGYHSWHGPHWSVWHSPFVSYTRWGIARISVRGWYGYHFGHTCYYWSWRPRHRHHRVYYHGVYCRVSRPYWYGYSRWYDWRPYRYGYSARVYDRIYDEGYSDGYHRGYVDGAEDVSAYRDDRRRERIATAPRPRMPDPAVDRARADASTEYRHEMNRGNAAFSEGDFASATQAFREAVILDPNSSHARYSLAMSAFAEGKYAFSAFALRRGIALDPEGSDIDVELALGGPDVLRDHLGMMNRELQAAPEDPDLLLLAGFVALRTGDARRAAELLDRANAALPGDAATRSLYEEAMGELENR
jgi:hypothetical protein